MEEEILEMKKNWEEKNPGRALRSEEIRNHYLEYKKRNFNYCLPGEDMLTEENEGGKELEDNSFTDVIPGTRPASSCMEFRVDLSKPNKFSREDYRKSLINPKLQRILKNIPGLDLSKYPGSGNRCYLTPMDAESLTFSRIVYVKDFSKLQKDMDKESAELRQILQGNNNQKIWEHVQRVMSEAECKTLGAYAQRASYLASTRKERQKSKRTIRKQ